MSLNSGPEDFDESPKVPTSTRRYVAGMLIYGALAVLAGLTLDGNIRIATWIFLGGLALKTCIAAIKDPMA